MLYPLTATNNIESPVRPDAPGPCPKTHQDGRSGSEDHLPLAGVLPRPLVGNRNIVDGVVRSAGVLVPKVR